MAALNEEFPVNDQPVEESLPVPDQPVQVPHHDEGVIVADTQIPNAQEVDGPVAETADPVEMQIDKVAAEWPNTNWWA